MKILKTKFNGAGVVQIQDHGTAFIVSFPSTVKGCQKEEIFSKNIGGNAWNKAQKFAAEKLKRLNDD